MRRNAGTFKLLGAVLAAAAAMAIAAPVAGASTFPSWFGFAFPSPAAIGVGGNQIGSAGCVGTNRPSVGGNNGSTSAQTCGAILSFVGPQIGQIASVVGPTVIGSPFAHVYVSAGPITVLP
jgi:hypothetical protein